MTFGKLESYALPLIRLVLGLILIFHGIGKLFFDKKLSFKGLQAFVQRIDKAFNGGGPIFQAICVAKDFDDIFFSDELKDKMEKQYLGYKMDLIKEDKSGFSTIWID